MSGMATPSGPAAPTVYFIDDSATMREVIKIAFRKENINVIACHSALSALEQFREHRPDAVITDVIMPDKDGFEVCQYVKEQAEFGATPVILMSGVVNRQVAERAMAVKADELIRKPFQPQDLIARVKALLNPHGAQKEAKVESPDASQGKSASSSSAAAQALGSLFAPAPSAVPMPPASVVPAAQRFSAPAPSRTPTAAPVSTPAPATPAVSPVAADTLKLRNEIRRLELLVKKLQSELEAERQYSAELESQLRVQQETS